MMHISVFSMLDEWSIYASAEHSVEEYCVQQFFSPNSPDCELSCASQGSSIMLLTFIHGGAL
jgi:hypothetical protein